MAQNKLSTEVSEMEKQQLIHISEELRRSSAALQLENEMFERHLNRLNLASQLESENFGVDSQRGRERHSKARSSACDQLPLLTTEQKCEVAQQELEEIKADLEKGKANAARVLNDLQADLEEAQIRLADIKKMRSEFERDIAKATQEKTGVRLGAEKLTRYFEDRMRLRDALIEKLRLMNATLKVHKRKVWMQLRQNEEMGEALQRVDFQKLKIENTEYLELNNKRNQELLHFKLKAGKVMQMLSSAKRCLQDATLESESLNYDVGSRRHMLAKIQVEMVLAEEERSKAEVLNRKLRRRLEEYSVPDVLQYVEVTMAHRKLEQTVRNWERKTEIAQMALKAHTKGCNRAWTGPSLESVTTL
ncbi:coiled-coil domain-containing protein 113 [Brienomyrus brachyistius]|uniref:coiled-coil domain-containing protein 113 n=1 Tax=Brienomyrus brachyistius TaxID=42636 RepID=UPI0020B3886C|nr:coiled-coil domain-containing protein 113 [Brienomyrus brachyistius]